MVAPRAMSRSGSHQSRRQYQLRSSVWPGRGAVHQLGTVPVDGRHLVDGFTWTSADIASDGVHPTAGAVDKVVLALLAFLKSDPTAAAWFLRLTVDVSGHDKSSELLGRSEPLSPVCQPGSEEQDCRRREDQKPRPAGQPAGQACVRQVEPREAHDRHGGAQTFAQPRQHKTDQDPERKEQELDPFGWADLG